MKVYVVMNYNDALPCAVFKTLSSAHKWLRRQGVHPIGGGHWGDEVKDIYDSFAYKVSKYEVKE